MQLTGIDRLFWALSFLGNCTLLGVLLYRRRWGLLPVFTTLISVDIVRTIVLFATLRFGTSEQYFYTYWTLAILDMALQLGLAYELAARVFQPLGAWAPDVRRSFITLAGVSVVLALGLMWLAAPPTRTLRTAIVIRGNFFASALMTELLVLMIALSVTLGLPWRTHVARVAQGIGVYAFNGMVTDAAHSYFGLSRGREAYHLLSHLQIGLYLMCLLYWIVTLWMKEPEPRKLPEDLHEELRVLQARAALILKSVRRVGATP